MFWAVEVGMDVDDGMGERSGDAGTQLRDGAPLTAESLKHVAPLLALSGLGAYAAAVYWQTCFYGEFGLSPDEVGVDHLTAFERATPLAVLFVLAFSFAAPLVGGFCAFCVDTVGWRGWVDRRKRSRPNLAVALPALVSSVICLVFGIFFAWADQQSRAGVNADPPPSSIIGLENLAFELAVVFVIVAGVRGFCFRYARGSILVTNVMSCLVFVVFATVQVGEYVSAAGRAVAAGQQGTSGWLIAVGVQTPGACVLPSSSPLAQPSSASGARVGAAVAAQGVLPVGEPLTLISRSGSTIVLYDSTTARSWFMDSKNVQLQTYASRRAAQDAGCSGQHR